MRYRRRPATVGATWLKQVTATFASVELPLPKAASHFYLDGRKGLHTEHLGLLLAEMQFPAKGLPRCNLVN